MSNFYRYCLSQVFLFIRHMLLMAPRIVHFSVPIGKIIKIWRPDGCYRRPNRIETGVRNRPRRKTAVLVGVIWRIISQILSSYLKSILPKNIREYCVSLERHADIKALPENPGHFLASFGRPRLLLEKRSHDHDILEGLPKLLNKALERRNATPEVFLHRENNFRLLYVWKKQIGVGE